MRVLDILVRTLCQIVPVKSLRRKIYRMILSRIYGASFYFKAKSIGRNTVFILPCGKANRRTTIGDRCSIGSIDIVGKGEVRIGNYCQIASVVMLTQNHNYLGDMIPFDHTNILKPVVVEDFVWIGQRVMILPGAHIGEGAIIQAGSVVHGEIPKCAIAGGNPAKVFAYRDVNHFEKMKMEGKFFCGK